ncbi:MAG TPA: helix-turn-helix transcriptional regulator, partial [Nocardioides sp.]|nr:helix-turn-helix transcriptional regulator [Nocardioides sp.]
DVAAQLGEAALRLTPPRDVADLRRRHIATAYHHVAAGSVPSALDHVAAALQLATEREDVADLEWRRAMFHFLLGDMEAAVDGLRTARRTTGRAELRDDLTRRLANMLCWHGRMRDALEEYGADLERISSSEAPASATALALRTVCCHVLGRPLPADPVTQVRQERARHPDLPAHDDPSIRLAAALLTTTDPRTAVEIHESARQRAVTHGDDLGIAWLASRASLAAAAAGDWRRAEEVAASGLVAAERLGSPPALVYALTAVGACAALAGNDTVAEDAARRLDPFGSFMFAGPQAAVIRGHLAWADDRADRAAVLFDQAEAQLRRLDIVEPTTPFLRWHRADVLLDAGRPDEAAEEADRLLHLANTVGHPLALAVGHRVRARLDDDPERFATALARPQLHAWPFERALTQYYSGTVLRRIRRIRDARVALTDALGGFTRLGAIRWAERTSSEIARLGGRTARPGSLTAAESRVAELAVRGLTNQEIADELVISARTVASHLSSAYAKLGARSRTELASILTEGVGPAQQ